MQMNIAKDWFMRQAALEGDHEIGAGTHACNCIGPQNGQPVCPCAMRSVTIENGRYVDRRDLGPAPSALGGSRAKKGEAPICTAKFKLVSRVENQAGFTLTFEPVTSGSPENDQFFKYTPWGKLELGTINPEAARAFNVGGEYLLPFVPAA